MRLEDQIGPNEHIIWSGTKDKKVSLLESIFNSMLPFALFWGLIDLTFIGTAVSAMRYDTYSDNGATPVGFFLLFFAFHLMPVWLYLGGVLTSVRKAKNTQYCVTDQAVYVQSGVFDTKVERRDYAQFVSLTIGQSFWDKRANTGDVRITLDEIYYTGKRHRRQNRMLNIENIADYQAVFQLVQQQRNAHQYNDTARGMNMGYPNVGYPNAGYPQYGTPQVPQYGNPQVPQYGNPQVPQYGNPQVPQYGNPQVPQYGNPQVPQYGNPQVPQYGNPQVPQYGNPQMPQPGNAEMAELFTPPAQDDFVDPTLSAFDFQNQNPDGNDGSGSGF